jgi:hypothetical protein
MASNIHFSSRLSSALDNLPSSNPLNQTLPVLSDKPLASLSKDFEKSSIGKIIQKNLGFYAEALKELPVPMWKGEELSYEEVVNLLSSNSQENKEHPSSAKDFFSKRGRWSSKDLIRLLSYVSAFDQSASNVQNVWESVSLLLHRHPESCQLRYYQLLKKAKK